MSQTSAFDIRNSQKLRNASKKYERPAPEPNPSADVPAPRMNIFERMDVAGNTHHDNSLHAIIDVIPDTRYILLFIVFHVMKLYTEKEHSAHPCLTPSSFTAYCLLLTYGFMLVNDYHGRPTPSYYASSFMDSDARAQLFEHLKKAYVPPFMMTLFHGLTDTSDPRRPGLQYFATFAGTRFDTDFGRIIPPQIFLASHNISAEQDTSRPGINAMNTLMAMIVFSTNANATAGYRIGQFLGSTTEVGTYRNWVYHAVLTLFSPVTGKTLQNRTNIEPLNLSPMRIDRNQAIEQRNITSNMYTMFLNADPTNVKATEHFILEFSNIVKTTFDGKFQLGAAPDDLSGISILTHGYSLYALPTWHALTVTDTPAGHRSIPATTFAAAIGYLQETNFQSETKFKYPDDDKLIEKSLYLVRNVEHKSDNEPSSDEIVEFDEELHIYPSCLWLQPYTSGDQAISYSMVTGLVIESLEVDGSSIPLPDPNVSLRMNNVLFMQGMIPISHVRSGLSTDPVSVFYREYLRKNNQKISLDLYNLAQNRLPIFDIDIQGPQEAELPGFTEVEHIRSFARAFSKLSFTSDTVPPTKRKLVIWSPYRYIFNDTDELPPTSQIFMMYNHRTLYGTSVLLTETEHPATLIPTS
uniref:Coat protein n=1 Tax=Podosphaera prunicola partitivirus 4 TaxID=2052570 RepID=A0A2P9JAN8_9VIRU|nr:coat protein [Podosphaera prunicola partitivirus 4]